MHHQEAKLNPQRGYDIIMTDHSALFAPDTGLAVLSVEGEDAGAFLDAQLMTALGDHDDFAACPTALADPKGRVLATFHLWRTQAGWHLATAAGEARWLLQHLSRFIFRSKVEIAQAPNISLLGIFGADAKATLEALGLSAPAHNRTARTHDLTVIGLAENRWLVAGTKSELDAVSKTLAARADTAGLADWDRARLLAGEVAIHAATRGRFLPQMLGLVNLDAVSFRKGCYPGQEIIARARRGKVKRGLVLLELENDSDKPVQSGGTLEHDGKRLEVLDAAPLPNGRVKIQAVTTL